MTPNASWDQCKALVEKHTDGPWLRIDKADYAEIHAAFRPSSAAVALVGRPSDADLIAAAPELVRELNRLVSLFEHALETPGYGQDERSREEADDHLNSARAVIAKARGQS